MASRLDGMPARRLSGPAESLNHSAYEAIRARIVGLELEPGSTIDERRLAGEMRLGLTPVRHALRRLAIENLVEIQPRHGTRVARINPDDLTRLFEMRVELEALAARLAAERINPEQAAELSALANSARAAHHEAALVLKPGPGEVEPDGDSLAALNQRLIQIDQRMHRLLAEASQNRFLLETLDWLYMHVQRLWNSRLARLTTLDHSMEEHCLVAEAVLQGDGDLAAGLMRTHVQHFQQEYLNA